MGIPDHRKAADASPLRADAIGTIAIEYALIAAMIVFGVVTVLQTIGGGAMLGLPPIVRALEAAIS